jgi:glutathione S-transferase
MQDIKPLTLHAHASGPNPYKAAMVLETLKLPYNVKLWDFSDADTGVKGAVYTKLNPNGRVPTIEDPNTGVVAWESMACINYILRQYDSENKSGVGPGASEQDKVDWDKW